MPLKEITKKEFLSLHKSGKIGLIQPIWNCTLSHAIKLVEGYKGTFSAMKVSRIDVNNQGDQVIIKCYSATINNQVFYFVAEIHDNSKSNETSSNDIRYLTIVYLEN